MSASTLVLQRIDSVKMPPLIGRGAYVAYLKFAHGIMRASQPLLRIAASKSVGALREYFRSHADEELGHDEWVAEDLASLGEKPELIDHAAAATAGAQYYYLHHVGPHALLGYMAALEMRPAPLHDVALLETLHGKPAVRTLRFHAEHDPEHAKELARMIDQCEEFAPIITYSAFVTATMIAYYLAERMRSK